MQVKMQLTVENLNISIKGEEVVVGKNYYRIVIEKNKNKNEATRFKKIIKEIIWNNKSEDWELSEPNSESKGKLLG